MIRLWLSRGTSISVREQISSQFILGILSRRLAPGERLPSIRKLARRLQIHANTISAIYKDLADRGWVHRRRGSGVFVRAAKLSERRASVDDFVRAWLREGVIRGFSADSLRASFLKIAQHPREQFIVVDPELELARVLAAEIGEAAGCALPFSTLESFDRESNFCVLINDAHAEQLHRVFSGATVRTIQLKSMQDVLAGRFRPASPILIGMVSRSESILKWASTLLSALGFPIECVVQRNPLRARWHDGLAACDVVATDLVTSADLQASGINATVVRVVSDEFLASIRELSDARS